MKKAIFLIPLLMLLFSCEEEEQEKYKFMILSTGGSFSGHYVLDGDDVVLIPTMVNVDDSETPLVDESASTQFVFEKSLKNPSSIKVVATGESDTNSLYVYVFENGDLKKEGSDSKTETGDIVSVSLYHEFSSDESSSQ